MGSILVDIRKAVGPGDDAEVFDDQLKMEINTAIADLLDVGVHDSVPFRVTDESETWEDLLGQEVFLDDAKTYVEIQVRLVFDPPANGTILQSLERQAAKCIWKVQERLAIKRQGGIPYG